MKFLIISLTLAAEIPLQVPTQTPAPICSGVDCIQEVSR